MFRIRLSDLGLMTAPSFPVVRIPTSLGLVEFLTHRLPSMIPTGSVLRHLDAISAKP
jgi:hypothetical protein